MRLRVLLLCLIASMFAAGPAAAFVWLGDPHPPPDTTPPTLVGVPGPISQEATSAGGANVSYTAPTATDDTDPSPSVLCSPASGSLFALGTTQVTCTATDASNNSSQASFGVTVQDTIAPVLGPPPASINDATEDPTGKVEVFSPPSATDAVGATVGCTPASGTKFPVGATTVTCTATDSSGNQSSNSFTVTITLQDHTDPVLSLPASFSVETENPGGTAVNYVATAHDNVDPSPSVVCTPASGVTLTVGAHPVSCTATDASGNDTNGSFTITVNLVDHTAPVLSGVPGDKTVEANGPEGSIVNYSTPTANDNLDGLIGAVTCSPASGSLFPLGATTVTCTATDTHGNPGVAAFTVFVADTTPPAIYLPTAASIVATSPTGIASSDPAAQAFFQAARALDMIDPHPIVTYETASQLSVGPNPVTFHARDASGNESEKTATLTVLALGAPTPPTPKPPTPPAEVRNVTVIPLDGAARIRWDAGGRQVSVTRSSSSARSLAALNDEVVVYTGTASSYTDRGLTNGIEYRYVVSAVDAAGNHSAGVAAVIVPRRNLLKSPKDGAKLRKAPKLIWAVDSEAQYYNAQLLLNGKKILSVWPVRPAYVLKKSWTYEGRKYTLKPGVYTWFVWPGYGARSAVDYGELMGARTFRIVR